MVVNEKKTKVMTNNGAANKRAPIRVTHQGREHVITYAQSYVYGILRITIHRPRKNEQHYEIACPRLNQACEQICHLC